MTIGNRTLSQIFKAIIEPQHYQAISRAFSIYDRPILRLSQYLMASGEYPSEVRVHTPVGDILVHLYSHHDLLTINEIFCRDDYRAAEHIRCVVDIGSNIGVSALYFLTRNLVAHVYLYEPVAFNLQRLEANLKPYLGSGRFELNSCAVADFEGSARFGIEPTGRYCGLQVEAASDTTVQVKEINSELKRILEVEGSIDILKLDTEGTEVATVLAIEERLIPYIGRIYMEANPNPQVFSQKYSQFTFQQSGSIACLINEQPNSAPQHSYISRR